MSLLIYVEDGCDMEEAKLLAEKLGVPITKEYPKAVSDKMIVVFEKRGVSLVGDGMILENDFNHLIPRIKKNNLDSEQIIRVAKIKGISCEDLTVMDATAGFGEDSFILAAAGFTVNLYEYNPIIATLLKDAVRKLSEDPEFKVIAQRMKVHSGDSIRAMSELNVAPDIIFLDPMFPKRQKSGLIKKKFQILQKLESPCDNEDELLNCAMKTGARKIIIKRPLKGPYLGLKKPSYSNEGKTIRYDCIILR